MKYRAQVIREARYHIGMEAPAHEFLAQIETESRCDAEVTAFDGGMGLGQFMAETAEWIQSKEKTLQNISLQPAPHDPRWSIRALILYDKWLYENVRCREWHYAYRAYNGGLGTINKEIKLAGTCDHQAVNAACNRKTIKVKKCVLDLCRVNIEYPYRIIKASKKYEH